MVKNIIIGILSVVLLTLLSTRLLSRNNNSSDTSVFQGNLECSKYLDQGNKESRELQDLEINKGNQVSAPTIFYSPKLHTCVKAFSIIAVNDSQGLNTYLIENLLTNDIILMENGKINDTTYDGMYSAKAAEEKFNQKLKELGANE